MVGCKTAIVACMGLQLLEVQVRQPTQQQLQLLVPQQTATAVMGAAISSMQPGACNGVDV